MGSGGQRRTPPRTPKAVTLSSAAKSSAQMIMAADAASAQRKVVKSIHGIFIRTGAYSAGPMELELESMHEGRAWASDTITAYQGDRLLARGLVLLNTIEPDLIRHAATMPDLPGPEECVPIERPVLFPGIEAREVDLIDPVTADGAPLRHLWLRMPAGFDSVAVNQAITAWCQPGFIIELALRPHRVMADIREAHRSISTGVISHTAHLPRRRRRQQMVPPHAGSDLRRQRPGRWIGHGIRRRRHPCVDIPSGRDGAPDGGRSGSPAQHVGARWVSAAEHRAERAD